MGNSVEALIALLCLKYELYEAFSFVKKNDIFLYLSELGYLSWNNKMDMSSERVNGRIQNFNYKW